MQQSRKRKEKDQAMNEETTTSIASGEQRPRKILKPVKKQQQKEQILDEDGQPLQFEDSEEELAGIEENVVQRDEEEGDWEDAGSDGEEESKMEVEGGKKKEKKGVKF